MLQRERIWIFYQAIVSGFSSSPPPEFCYRSFTKKLQFSEILIADYEMSISLGISAYYFIAYIQLKNCLFTDQFMS